MKTFELKDCPICGKPPTCQTAERAGNGELYQLAGVWCKPCDIQTYSSSDEEATRKWNDRAGRKAEAVQNVGNIAGAFQRKVSVLFELAGTEAHANRVEHQLADAMNEAAMEVLTDYAHERGEEVAWEVRGSKHANGRGERPGPKDA